MWSRGRKVARESFWGSAPSIPSLSINYFAINKDLEKLPTQLCWINMKICYDQYYLWLRSFHSNEMTPLNTSKYYVQPYFSAPETRLPKSFRWAFSSNKSLQALSIYYWLKFLWLKTGQSWCSAVMWRNWSAFEMQFHPIVVSIFLKTCVKNRGESFTDCHNL